MCLIPWDVKNHMHPKAFKMFIHLNFQRSLSLICYTYKLNEEWKYNHTHAHYYTIFSFRLSSRTLRKISSPFEQKSATHWLHRKIQVWWIWCECWADSGSSKQLPEDWQPPRTSTRQETAAGQVLAAAATGTGSGSTVMPVGPTRKPGNTNGHRVKFWSWPVIWTSDVLGGHQDGHGWIC